MRNLKERKGREERADEEKKEEKERNDAQKAEDNDTCREIHQHMSTQGEGEAFVEDFDCTYREIFGMQFSIEINYTLDISPLHAQREKIYIQMHEEMRGVWTPPTNLTLYTRNLHSLPLSLYTYIHTYREV